LSYQLEAGMVKRVTPAGPPGSPRSPSSRRRPRHLRIAIIDPEREKAGNRFSQAPYQLIVEFLCGINRPADSAEEVCDGGNDDLLLLKGELGKMGSANTSAAARSLSGKAPAGYPRLRNAGC
jgi:hypothetical protein